MWVIPLTWVYFKESRSSEATVFFPAIGGLHFLPAVCDVICNLCYLRLCWLSWCLRRSTFLWKPLEQISHPNGLNPVCLRLCVMRLELWLKALPHTWHLWGFSPVNKHKICQLKSMLICIKIPENLCFKASLDLRATQICSVFQHRSGCLLHAKQTFQEASEKQEDQLCKSRQHLFNFLFLIYL